MLKILNNVSISDKLIVNSSIINGPILNILQYVGFEHCSRCNKFLEINQYMFRPWPWCVTGLFYGRHINCLLCDNCIITQNIVDKLNLYRVCLDISKVNYVCIKENKLIVHKRNKKLIDNDIGEKNNLTKSNEFDKLIKEMYDISNKITNYTEFQKIFK